MPNGISRRFTPPSLGDFTRTARDLAGVYGLKLARAQEYLTRIYGYEDGRATPAAPGTLGQACDDATRAKLLLGRSS